jgi:hypothetical protein
VALLCSGVEAAEAAGETEEGAEGAGVRAAAGVRAGMGAMVEWSPVGREREGVMEGTATETGDGCSPAFDTC